MFRTVHGGCYYSNGIVLNAPDGGKRLLVQYSEIYERACVNVFHVWIRKTIEQLIQYSRQALSDICRMMSVLIQNRAWQQEKYL